MDIICVMATYKRPGITKRTIELLQQQTYPLSKIVLIGSERLDGEIALRTGCDFVLHKNLPLSNKWQYGMDYARQFEPDAILINGSDSWLSVNWCEISKRYIEEGFYLTGRNKFNTCQINSNQPLEIISRTYTTRKDPIGAGRLISSEVLDLLDWQWFRPGINSGLDGNSFKKMLTVTTIEKVKLLNEYDEMAVMDVKSSAWPTITPFQFIKNNKMFTALDEIKDPASWAEERFPGATKIFKELVPNVVIKENIV